MTVNYPASRLSYVIINNNGSDDLLAKGETWKFIVGVEDALEAYQQMSKCKTAADRLGHTIANIYLDGIPFNPRGWYTDGVNEDKIAYEDKIKIDNLIDETKKAPFSSEWASRSHKTSGRKQNKAEAAKKPTGSRLGKLERQEISVTLTEHARLDCMPLRHGVLLSSGKMKFSGIYDPEATKNQKPKEISNGHEHFVGSLHVDDTTSYKDMRVVLSKEGTTVARRVISILPSQNNFSTRGVSELIRDLRLQKKITPEQIAGVLHPLFKEGKISREVDLFEELVRIGISLSKEPAAKPRKRGAGPPKEGSAEPMSIQAKHAHQPKAEIPSGVTTTHKPASRDIATASSGLIDARKDNNERFRPLMLMLTCVAVIVSYMLISGESEEQHEGKPQDIEQPIFADVQQSAKGWSTSGCEANYFPVNKNISRVHLKRESTKIFLDLVFYIDLPQSVGKVFIEANIGEEIVEQYKAIGDLRRARVDFSLYESYLKNAKHLNFRIGEANAGMVVLPDNTAIMLNKINNC